MIPVLLLLAAGSLSVGVALSARARSRRVGIALQAAGSLLLAVAGLAVVASGHPVGDVFTSRFTPRFGLDGLSGFFLATLGLVAAPALAYSEGYLGDTARERAVSALTGVFVLVMAALLAARDPVSLLGSWELMTLLPAAIILIHRGADRESRSTAFVYLAITHLGGAGTWVSILLLAKAGAIGAPGMVATGSGLQIGVALAALVGMGTKAGLVPLHAWLPRAHPMAPAPVSALMSGVMVKLAVYAMVRVFVDWLGVLPGWFGVLVLASGALSAVGGVTYALFQPELKRLLALSSIENVGIIVLGLGACLLLRSHGDGTWAALALAASLLHALNHAVFKSLLFLGAGSVERATHSLRLDRLGGLLRRMPWTGAGLLIGGMSIAGLPPLNGFVSEWFTFQSLLHVSMGRQGDGVYGAVAIGALAATAAMAVFTFVKVVGLVLLGPPRTPAVGAATEVTASMRYPVIGLAGVCVALGLLPGLLVGRLVTMVPWRVAGTTSLALHLPATGSLPTVALGLFLVLATGALFGLRGSRRAAPAPTWACGQDPVPALNWTSAGFTKPLQLVMGAVLRPRREVRVRREGGVTTEVVHRSEVPNLIDERLYRPAIRAALAGARHARRLQSGSVGAYAGYLIGLVVVALAAGRLGWLG